MDCTAYKVKIKIIKCRVSLDEFSSFEQNCGHKTLCIFLKVSLFKKHAQNVTMIVHVFYVPSSHPGVQWKSVIAHVNYAGSMY